MNKTLSGRLRELNNKGKVQLGTLFITKFKSQFILGFTKVVATWAGRFLRECSQWELRLYLIRCTSTILYFIMWLNPPLSASGQDKANLAFWLATRVGKPGVSRAGPARKSSLFGHTINSLLTKLVRSIYIAGQLSSFFFAFFLFFILHFIDRNERIYKHTLLLKETRRLTGIFKLYFDRKVVTHVLSLGKKSSLR